MAARKLKVSTTGYKENSKDKNLDKLYVPSPNLTMTNVKKRVKATPVYPNDTYGNPITMIPGVPSYTFPGAIGVIEEKLPKAQTGKNILYVNSKNDPAYKAYRDSMDVYNAYPDLDLTTNWGDVLQQIDTDNQEVSQWPYYADIVPNLNFVNAHAIKPNRKIETGVSRPYPSYYGGINIVPVSNYVYKKPTRQVIVDDAPKPVMKEATGFSIPQVDIQPQLGNIPELSIPKDSKKQRVVINTAQGDKIRVQDPKTKKFMWWEDQEGLPSDIENPTGIPQYDFKYAEGGQLPDPEPGLPYGGAEALKLNYGFNFTYDISKSLEENAELNRRAKAMGWTSVAEYKKSGWKANERRLQDFIVADKQQKAQRAGTQVLNADEIINNSNAVIDRSELDRETKASADWEKNWYSKRAQLPQFTDVATQRLNHINDIKTVAWRDAEFKKQYPYAGAVYVPNFNTVNFPEFSYRKRPPFPNGFIAPNTTVTHERSHWYDYNYPQSMPNEGTDYNYRDLGQILGSIIPKDYTIESPDGTNRTLLMEDIKKPYSPNDRRMQIGYWYEPTEIRARLNEWRRFHNIDPLKNYTNEEIQKIIDNDIRTDGKYWNGYYNMDLYKLLRGRGDLLKQLNDRFVSNGNRQSSDGVFRGERGGQLPKAQLKGSVNKQRDKSQPYAYLDPRTNTWLRPPENPDHTTMIDWSVNTPAFETKTFEISGGKKVSPEEAARNKEKYRQEYLKTPEGREEERKRLMQEFVDHENANKSELQKSFGNLSLENPATRDAARNYAGYKLGESSPMWSTDKMLTGHDEPTTRDYYRPHESTLSFGIPAAAASAVSLGAGAAELQPIVQGFNNLMSKEVTLGNTPVSINSLTKAKGTYDILTNTAPQAYNSFKTYSQTGNTDDLLKGLENTGRLAIEGFSNFGPAKSTVKQIGKYYGIGQSTNDAYNAQTTGQFAGSSYDAGKGIYSVIKGKKKGG